MGMGSCQSRAYLDDESGWEWINWGDGEVNGTMLHKCPINNDVHIKEAEVMF